MVKAKKVKQLVQPKQPVKKQSSLLQFQGFHRTTNNDNGAVNPEVDSAKNCEFCGQVFQHNGAIYAHKLFCKENPKRMATVKDLDETTERSESLNPNAIVSEIINGLLSNVDQSTSGPGGWKLAKIFDKPRNRSLVENSSNLR